jgi:hypothetical protein
MTVFERLHMPSLGGTTERLNSGPLGPAELNGHVVLVSSRQRHNGGAR